MKCEMATHDKAKGQAVWNRETFKQIVCFFFFGLLCLVYNVIVITAAPDVLSGSSFATSSVMISESLPTFLVKLIAPWFMQKVSYLKRVVVIVLLCLTGLIVLVTAGEPQWRLVGFFILCLGSSLSEITFLALTSQYEHVTISAFVAGVGCSSLVGTLYYTGWFLPFKIYCLTLAQSSCKHDLHILASLPCHTTVTQKKFIFSCKGIIIGGLLIHEIIFTRIPVNHKT